MARIRILGPSSRLPAVIGQLQDVGALHIDSSPSDIRRLESDIPALRRHVLDPASQQARASVESALEKVRRLLFALPALPEGQGAESGEPPLPDEAGESALEAVHAGLDSLVARVESIVSDLKRHRDEQSLFSRYDKVLKVLSPLIRMVRESRELECTGLILPARERAVAALLEEGLSRLTDGRFEIVYREVDKDTLAGLLIYPGGKTAEARSLLWEKNIGELRLPSSVADKPLPEALDIVARRRAELPPEIRKLEEGLAGISREWRGRLLDLRRRLGNRVERIRVSASVHETRMTFLLYGWIPAEELERLTGTLSARFGDIVVVERIPVDRPEEEESAPVVLRNRPAVRPFEIFTRVLPLPRYGTIDPTPLLALFFPLFYGIILGDVGYGFLLLAIARFAARRHGKNPFVADAAAVFSWAALSAVAWGFAYGELFGDLGERLGMRPLLLRRMEDFRNALLFSLAIGAAHVLLGIGLGIYTAFRRGKRGEMAAKAAGLLLLVSFAATVAGAAGEAPSAFLVPGLAGAAASLLAMILAGGAGAVMEAHNLVNVLSYLRITGIGVASVALAYTANRIVGLVGIPVLGILAGVTLHAVNLAFCVLSPAIQALRLHYVEFFENFFLGGGRAYRPFRTLA